MNIPYFLLILYRQAILALPKDPAKIKIISDNLLEPFFTVSFYLDSLMQQLLIIPGGILISLTDFSFFMKGKDIHSFSLKYYTSWFLT